MSRHTGCRDKTRLLSRQKYACRDKRVVGKNYACRDKTFLSRQNLCRYVCRYKTRSFVATKACLSKQNFDVCRNILLSRKKSTQKKHKKKQKIRLLSRQSMLVVTNVWSGKNYACRDKTFLSRQKVGKKLCLSRQNIFVATKPLSLRLSLQNTSFVATKACLSKQNFLSRQTRVCCRQNLCRDKNDYIWQLPQ